MHDGIELGVPMERLGVAEPVIFLLQTAGGCVEVVVEQFADDSEAFVDFLFRRNELLAVAREVELFAAEEIKCHRRLSQFGVDLPLQLGIGEHVAVDKGVFDFLFRGISDERVAAADVEIDVGERVEAEVGVVFVHVHHGDHLEEETESRDFRGLVHDVHAVEVAEDDGFVDEVLAVAAVAGRPPYHFGEFILEEVGILGVEFLHAVEARLVERFEDVERGEEERARAAGGIEDRHLAQRLVEMKHEFVVGRVADDVLGEGADVEVVGDEVVDG